MIQITTYRFGERHSDSLLNFNNIQEAFEVYSRNYEDVYWEDEGESFVAQNIDSIKWSYFIELIQDV